MERDEQFVRHLYSQYLGREPSAEERQHWVSYAGARSYSELAAIFAASDEARARGGFDLPFPIGHYYSPFALPEQARVLKDPRSVDPSELYGIALRLEEQRLFWAMNYATIADFRPPSIKTDGFRYYYDNDVFSIGDAITLSLMIRTFRPQNIVEVGSGFSSACMLDVIDQTADFEPTISFIDPEPERLMSLLTPNDLSLVSIYKDAIQNVEYSLFSDLAENDILFIDSTHVMKTGSDVCHELFDILPRLNPGVIIHFHDMFYPFEYPRDWVERGFSWNELYGVRAFLMYNDAFEILFFNHALATLFPDDFDSRPEYLLNPGGGLWLRKR